VAVGVADEKAAVAALRKVLEPRPADVDALLALAPGRFARQVDVIAEAAALDRMRLLRWTLAFASLSAVWILGDGDHPGLDLAVAELAAAALKS